MKLILLLFVSNLAIADARLIGTSTTHFMFNYHGDALFCPKEVDNFNIVTCLDSDHKYIICRMLPQELGYIDCGHKTKAPISGLPA